MTERKGFDSMDLQRNGDPAGKIAGIRCFLLDMDGTVYLGDRLLEGAAGFLKRVRETGRDFAFLTNNSSKSRGAYLEKLERLGIPADEKHLVTSGQATIRYLQREHPDQSVYLLGNPVLRREFEEAGIPLEEQHPDLVVTAFDTTLDYEKMRRVCDLVRQGLPFLATHPDYNCPTEDGFMPDIGAIHAFIHASAGRMPDTVIGKPSGEIVHCALEQMGFAAGEAAMAGDRLYTDIAVADNVPGLTSLLVLTGETALADLEDSQVQPHLLFDSLAAVTPLL